MTVEEITVQELKNILDENQSVLLIDVREQFEKDLVDIGGELIPLGEFESRLDEIDPKKDQPVVIYCRSGARSAEACRTLMEAGYPDVKNLKGGILEWAREIDPSLPTY